MGETGVWALEGGRSRVFYSDTHTLCELIQLSIGRIAYLRRTVVASQERESARVCETRSQRNRVSVESPISAAGAVRSELWTALSSLDRTNALRPHTVVCLPFDAVSTILKMPNGLLRNGRGLRAMRAPATSASSCAEFNLPSSGTRAITARAKT